MESATCPYCGYEEEDTWEIEIDNGGYIINECPDCYKEYKLHRDIWISHTSEKLEEEK